MFMFSRELESDQARMAGHGEPRAKPDRTQCCVRYRIPISLGKMLLISLQFRQAPDVGFSNFSRAVIARLKEASPAEE